TPELMFSFPLKSDGKNWSIVSELKHNTFAQEKIRATHEELLSERDAVR
ncbi:MAG: malate dehydrogenase, partial [Candidatus Omnitrophica bacterium CG12_big_fil_rev_8_21_14_0_65_50_5]